jgi:hypothetical protein
MLMGLVCDDCIVLASIMITFAVYRTRNPARTLMMLMPAMLAPTCAATPVDAGDEGCAEVGVVLLPPPGVLGL